MLMVKSDMVTLGRLDFSAWVACSAVSYSLISLISTGLCTRKADIYSSDCLANMALCLTL